ncbi:putative membrane protein [Propionispora sp. 2/2-37]|uniref:transglycosylase domain-containing protein n=1 Tax=Propionispora sp. 2/2-37 TaxID=1677858 RepID=UPI0006BB7668|nr:penicillin-binding protein 1A [Propionispora sp. 2/2-37]CUH96207.1 putative membrane protein [Propionispora sp. 2/2-37]
MYNEQKDKQSKSRRTSKKFLSRIAVIAIIIFVVMVAGAGIGFLTASIQTMPGLKGDIRPAASSQIFDSQGTPITTIHSTENRLPVSINKIPKNLQNAFIATEDSRFYQHIGIDPKGILRAVWANITNRGVAEGGSTITQQLAKNALLTQDQTIKRKIQEAFLALQIEQQYTKTEILEMYLNHIYFGQGAYGVQSAAQVYFGKNVEDLTLAECAMLAGIPKSPNYYSPLNNLKAATQRQATVLEQMVKYGYIDGNTAAKTQKEKLVLASKSGQNSVSDVAPYFVDYVLQQLIDKYGADAVYKEGLKIYTTLDTHMQEAAEAAMQQLPTVKTDSSGIQQPQGALVAIDPHTGYIKAMVGGRGTDQFNRAVMAERQPGSAFKPFVYLAAIESGMTASTIVDDSPISFDNWSPVNYDNKFHGKVTLRTALENSLNVPTVKLAKQLGADKPLYYAQQMGISTLVLDGGTNDRNLAMALGGLTRGVTPLELASAYGVLANQGVRAQPVAILKVVDRNGKVLEEYTPHEKAVINERSAYILTDILKGVILRGTGTAAAIGRPAAGKTGTTNDYKDAWFVGYTPDLVASVWMGNDNDGYLNGITGGTIPARIWHTFMSKALTTVPARDFPRPSGIISATISTEDGLLVNDPNNKDAKSEIFIEGTQPSKQSASSSDTGKEKDKEKTKNKTGEVPSDNATEPSADSNTLPPLPKREEDTALPPPPSPSSERDKKNIP